MKEQRTETKMQDLKTTEPLDPVGYQTAYSLEQPLGEHPENSIKATLPCKSGVVRDPC